VPCSEYTVEYYEKKHHLRCPVCGGENIIRWGFKSGHQRYRCVGCRRTHEITIRKDITHEKYFIHFKRWITTNTPLCVLKDLARVSSKTLLRRFDYFLAHKPPLQKFSQKQTIWLKVDGTYFGAWGCVLVYKAGKDILYWQFSTREYYDVYVAGLRWLMSAGYVIAGVTSDWHGSIVAAVQYLFPTIPHQRCLVHTQRLCQALITTRPKTEAGYMLLRIVRELNYLHNYCDVRIWTNWLTLWEKRYGVLIKERTQGTKDDGTRTWWYTHRNLRRAFRTLSTSQTHLFLYLDNPGLDKDTNGLEAEFTHLKGKLGAHRGLSRKRRSGYISWYLFFKSI
jgi:transposase-like protein